MWVRIDEIAFTPRRAEDVIAHTRNNAVVAHEGDSFLGFRLLVDRPHGRALHVSYWHDFDQAAADRSGSMTVPPPGPETTLLRSNLYELAIDAVQ